MDERKQEARTKKRRHSPRQLLTRPLTLNSCRGEIVVGSVDRNGVVEVIVTYPADVPVSQPPAVK